jgi:hypothetical protein
MEKLLYFKLINCPYCVQADNWIKELCDENADYAKIEIRIIEEDKEVDFANSHDYYYVPTFFMSNKKLHEGAATKEKVKAVLDYALEISLV